MRFGERVLFDDLSVVVGPHDRIGLVGSNGAGKSTLLKIVAGLTEAHKGTISRAAYVSTGYLPQDGVTATGRTLYAEVESAFEHVLEVQQKLEEARQRLATTNVESPEYTDTLEVFGELQHKLEDLDAYRMKSKIERVLMGLGFAVSDFDRETGEFSGGWQMRIELAKLLLREPSVLLLDEPTNHLDLDSLQWFEEYLHSYNGAIFLVSHDRAFLDSLTTTTIAISLGKADIYPGNYSFFERERELRRELTANAYRNQQQQLKQTMVFIDRFRYKATKARQVQSRIKQLEKMDRIELEDEEEEIHFSFPPPPPSGRTVIELSRMSKRYGPIEVFRDLNYDIERGDKIAIVGVNGAGKSTLVRILAGQEAISGGSRIVGHNVLLSYFGQHQAEELDLTKEAIDILDDVASGEVRKRLRTILGAFLFHGDDVFKTVSVLSGGEKSRLALAKMLLQPSNFLIMDEPTNHLDMRSKAVLQEALSGFEGTFVIVSHDRSFLDPIVNKVLEVHRGGVTVYPGNITEYLEKKRTERELADSTAGIPDVQKQQSFGMSEKERKRAEAERRQVLHRILQPQKKRLAEIEAHIASLEKRAREIDALMMDPEFYRLGEEAKAIARERRELDHTLAEKYVDWEHVTQEIESIQKEHP
jgi:ATP-binding cassette subfamily F protein 3